MDFGVGELTSVEALKASVAEMIATALFVMVGVGALAGVIANGGNDGIPVIAVAHGLTYGLLAAGIAGISGGHINPAVTFAMVITGQISVVRGVMFIVAQLIGACLGALILRAFLLDELLRAIPGAGGHVLSTDLVTEAWHGMFLEAMGTFLLVWTIFALAVNRRSGSGPSAPMYVGFAVLVIHLFLFPLTGAGTNPARSLGPALFLPAVAEGGPGRFDDHWIYWIGPLLGAAAASLTYYLLYLMPARSESEA
jgi:MIP family channel proteins